MAFTFDATADRGKVRLLIGDIRSDVPGSPIFQDEEIDAFLSIEGGTVKLAAALAAETIAFNEALVLKKLTLLGGHVETDGPAVAKELRASAAAWREQVDVDGAFDIAEQVVDQFTYRDRIWKQRQRGVL